MVSKRSEYGFIGYDTPIIPRARRSIRKKRSSKKIFHEGQQLCAFELLATVAGKLLQEAEGSSTSSSAAVRPDGTHKDQLINREVEEQLQTYQDDHGSSEESVVSSGLRLLKCPRRDADKKIFKNSSPVDSSACSIKISCSDMKSASNKCEDEFVHLPSKVDGGSPKCGESVGANVDNETPSAGDGDGGLDGEFLPAANKCKAKDETVRFSGKSPTQKDLNNEVNAVLEQLPRGRGASIPDPSFIRHRNDVKIDSTRDDDEIFSRFSDPHSSDIKTCRSTTPVGDRGPNKMLGSKYWKSVPKLDDCEASNNSAGENDTYRNKKFSYTHERLPQHTAPFKKRKLFSQSSVVTQDAGVSSESISNSTKKVVYDNKSSPVLKPHKDNGVSSPTMDRQRAPANSHVKLSIKSFKVPELLIEVPDSTSVGSLKKTVLEAVTTVFGGGLRVGLLFNGKRVRDDSRTLLQAGLAGGGNLDNLGFLLEPCSPTTLPSSTLSPKVSPTVATDDSPKDFVNRPFLTRKEESNLIDLLDKKPVPNSTKVVAGNGRHDLVPFSVPLKSERKPISDSRSLAAVPEKVEPLAVVPAGQRPRRAEMGQRRTRRPFSVSEVEALVQAVEKLGTGRWRDVKLCAFENAKHRTYVDLKDKWKTLVHTARISPQQRRGEPVPQELLDRVLAAHAYWSQHQAKQNGKPQYQHHHHPHQASQIHVEKVAA